MTEPDTQTVLGQRATPEAKVCSLVWRKPLKQPQRSRPWHFITLRLGATSEATAEKLNEYFSSVFLSLNPQKSCENAL